MAAWRKLRYAGVQVGDSLLLSRPRREPGKECIDGQWRDKGPLPNQGPRPVPKKFTVRGILAREGVGRMSRGEVVVIDYRFGKELFAGAHVDCLAERLHDFHDEAPRSIDFIF